jgi:hypothetical protein
MEPVNVWFHCDMFINETVLKRIYNTINFAVNLTLKGNDTPKFNYESYHENTWENGGTAPRTQPLEQSTPTGLS